MCLIITGKSNKVRATLLNTVGLLDDIYGANSDGVGFMYGTTDGLKIIKHLPKSVADARAAVSRMPDDDREVAIHWRMTTHGDTDLINCHPYDVIPGYVAMMHNGILHTGNAADKSKSDTWHFIKDYIASPVSEHPDLVFNLAFLDMLGDHIGNNRFVFMNGEGRISHVNFDQGVEHDGMWFSNTYAWVPSRLIPSYRSAKYATYKANPMLDDDEYDYQEWWDKKSGQLKPTKLVSAHHPAYNEADYEFDDDTVPMHDFTEDDVAIAVRDCEVDMFEYMLQQDPEEMLSILFTYYDPVATNWTKLENLSKREGDVYDMLLRGDIASLVEYAEVSYHAPTVLAEVIAYYLDWKEVEPQETVAQK
jgi:hypothetical protein